MANVYNGEIQISASTYRDSSFIRNALLLTRSNITANDFTVERVAKVGATDEVLIYLNLDSHLTMGGSTIAELTNQRFLTSLGSSMDISGTTFRNIILPVD